MGDVSTCGFEGFAVMGIIIGSLIASIGYSFFKNNKLSLEKEITS